MLDGGGGAKQRPEATYSGAAQASSGQETRLSDPIRRPFQRLAPAVEAAASRWAALSGGACKERSEGGAARRWAHVLGPCPWPHGPHDALICGALWLVASPPAPAGTLSAQRNRSKRCRKMQDSGPDSGMQWHSAAAVGGIQWACSGRSGSGGRRHSDWAGSRSQGHGWAWHRKSIFFASVLLPVRFLVLAHGSTARFFLCIPDRRCTPEPEPRASPESAAADPQSLSETHLPACCLHRTPQPCRRCGNTTSPPSRARPLWSGRTVTSRSSGTASY